MTEGPQLLLVGAVAAVGVLHTLVPDHWMPIVILARQRGWSRAETALAALRAGAGHVASTLAIGAAVWFAGAEASRHFGRLVDLAASLALIGFGGWIAFSAWNERHRPSAHGHGHPHRHDRHHTHRDADDSVWLSAGGTAAALTWHVHRHRHADGRVHAHWHEHTAAGIHPDRVVGTPLHEHGHGAGGRAALLLILGSSPMVEGIPAFFAAAKYGAALLGIMAAAFAAGTIGTYVLLCAAASAGLERVQFGAVERYGEMASGALIALVGVVFWLWPAF